MSEQNAILSAYKITGDGTGQRLSGKDIAKQIKDDCLAWVHFDGNQEATRDWLVKELTYLDTLIIDALLAEETRPRILEHGNGFLLILRGVNLNENAQPEDMVSIRLWIDPSRIISIQKRGLRAVSDIENRLSSGIGPKISADFVTMLISRLFERMEPVLSELDERTDNIEEVVSEEPSIKHRHEIVHIRKQAIIFRRYIMPQRDVISYLKNSEMNWLEVIHKRKLQESLDRTMRYLEDLDTIRERAQIIKDELSSGLADKLNKNMYVLSVVAAIFLPLGFLTGLLGINIAGIPGADYTHAFWVFVAMLFGVVIFQVILFKKLKWL